VLPSCAWLECYVKLYALSGEQDTKGQAQRCPDLRGRMPTRHFFGRPGARVTHLTNDLINSLDPTSQISSVWRIPPVSKREKRHGSHPTRKPLRLIRRALVASTREGDLVFDPFCGSGTSGVGAKELGRFFDSLWGRSWKKSSASSCSGA
jgi:hypothetical protein